MDYGGILRRALDISWHHRWLWLLALLAGEGSSGASFNYRVPADLSQPAFTPSSSSGSVPPPDFQPFVDWVAGHAGLLVAAGVGFLAAMVVLFVISVAAEAAAVRGVAAIDAGSSTGLGAAWRLGGPVFWPLLGMRLLAFVIGLAIAVALFGLIGLALLAGFAGHAPGLAAVLGWQALGLAAALVPVGVAAPTILKLAAREIALAGAGSWEGIVRAVGLGRRRIGPVVILWVIELACGLGVGLGFLIAGASLVAPLAVAGYAAWRNASAAGFVAVGLGGVVVAVVLLVASAAVAAFFSSFWTVGYRRLVAQP